MSFIPFSLVIHTLIGMKNATIREKFLLGLGISCMLLGSFAFVDRAVLGFMVDILQGVLYVASGLFIFAALMRGEPYIKRYSLALGIIYSLVFLAGIINRDGVVFWLFHAGGLENILHLGFAATLLFASRGEQAWERFAARKWVA